MAITRAGTLRHSYLLAMVDYGRKDMVFNTRKEAEAHDKMLDIAERLYTFLHAAEIDMAEDTLEALTVFMAQHREPIGTILEGGRLQTPDVKTQQAALPQDKREESSTSAQKSSKASQSAPTTNRNWGAWMRWRICPPGASMDAASSCMMRARLHLSRTKCCVRQLPRQFGGVLSLAYQARLPCAEPAAYLLRMVLRGSRSRARRILMRPRPHAYGRSHACKVCSVHG